MIKRILCRLLGLGKLPKVVKAALKAEGIRILEEGVRMSVTHRYFRAPGNMSSMGLELRWKTWGRNTYSVAHVQ